MQILLASAKIMNAVTSVDIPMKSKPKFQEQAGLFALELSTWDTNRLMKELKCSQAIALENQQRYQSLPERGRAVAFHPCLLWPGI